jgi:cell wall-associated NlpC family hydrolase
MPTPTDPLVARARQYLSVPYVWGGNSPAGLDCSGLVWLVFHQLGLSLPRTAQQQFDATQRVSQAAVKPGDLVFFAQTYPDPANWITHIGIYVGNGDMISAPTIGDVVRVTPVWTGFWGAHYAGAGRVQSR